MENRTLTLEELRELHWKRNTSCVFIYMKTHRTDPGMKQEPIRFKNLVHQAESKLMTQEHLEEDVYKLLKPLQRLESDMDFWQHQREGLTIFSSKDFMKIYRLPIELAELLVVAYRFQTQPLIRLFFTDQRFFVLALGLKTVRLFAGNSYSLDEVNVEGLPEGLRETLAQLNVQNDLQTHSAGRGSAQSQAIFHGHDSSGKERIRIEQHFRAVSSKIDEVLRNETAPLLLCGVGYLVTMYRTMSSYSNLLPEILSVSLETIVLSDLYRDAKSVVEPYLQKSTDLKNTSPNFRFGVTSGLLVRLNPWVNKKVAALTEVKDFDESLLKPQRFTFYFAISTKKTQFRPVAALAFNYVFDMIQRPGFTYPVTLLLDELTNYVYLPELPDKLTHTRHQQIGSTLGIQHPILLTKVYGDKDAILLMTQPGTRVYFPPRDGRSAYTVSQSLGNQTIQIRKVTPSGSIHEDERGRPLMDPSEILRLPKSNVVCMTPTTNPLILKTFHPTEHDQYTKQPPPQRRKLQADDRLVDLCKAARKKTDWKDVATKQMNNYKDKTNPQDKADSKPAEEELDNNRRDISSALPAVTEKSERSDGSGWGENEYSRDNQNEWDSKEEYPYESDGWSDREY